MNSKYKLLILTRQDDSIVNEVHYRTLSDVRAAVEDFFYTTNGEPNIRSISYYYKALMWSDEDKDYIGIYI